MTNDKKRTVVSVSIHGVVAVVLIGLMVFLTMKNRNGEYYELAINKSLSNTLNGSLIKTVFATFFAVAAEYPAYLILPVFAPVLFYSSDTVPEKYRVLFKILTIVLTMSGWIILCFASEAVGYIKDAGLEGAPFYIAMGVCSAVGFALSMILVRYIPAKKRRFLFKFAVFAILYLLIALAANQILKSVWHRMRFRDMLKENAAGNNGFGYYTPWYVIDIGRAELSPDYEYTSFPSGHSSSAVHIFLLVALCDYLPKWREKVWLKPLLYLVCTAFVVLTAIARICADAHFLSDTIAGAGISYIIFITMNLMVLKRNKEYNDSVIVEKEVSYT